VIDVYEVLEIGATTSEVEMLQMKERG
jgi:hypothetical protein